MANSKTDAAPPEGITMTADAAASEYFNAYAKKLDQQQRVAVSRFVSWCGQSRELNGISAHEMTLFQEAQGANVANLGARLMPVKAFLAFAKKRTWTATNLGVHLRVKKASVTAGAVQAVVESGDDAASEMTREGYEALKVELERRKDERPEVALELQSAMADKDFRENAPLDAARDAQAMLEATIRDLEHQVAHAVVVETNARPASDEARLGSMVEVTNLVSKKSVGYTLVGHTEADAAAGRISVVSPLGKALVGHGAGDVVDVAAPAGTIQFRIESVEG